MQNLDVQRPQSQASTARLSGKSAEGRGSLSSTKSLNMGNETEIEKNIQTPTTAVPIDNSNTPSADEKESNNEEKKETDNEETTPLTVDLPTIEKETTDNPEQSQSAGPNLAAPLEEPTPEVNQDNQTAEENPQNPVEEIITATNVCEIQQNQSPTEAEPERIQQTPTPIPPALEDEPRPLSSEAPVEKSDVALEESGVTIGENEQKENPAEINTTTEDKNDSAISSTKSMSPDKEMTGSPLLERQGTPVIEVA